MYFSFGLPLYSGILLVIGLLLTVVLAMWHGVRAKRLVRFVQEEERRDYLAEEQLPGVSVIVYARNDADWLERFLPLILQQNYPSFEVIVVDDGSDDGSKDLLSDMLTRYAHLRVTFSPNDTRALSRKKLAIMIGIKASQHDIVLTTNANCRMMSDDWLRLMMRNFVSGIDVVLGYSHFRYHKDVTPGRFYRVFDAVVVSVQWLLYAMRGKPYRGTSDNMAYRKKLFFDAQGFSKSLDLRWGEDDVFVSEIVRNRNSRLELSTDSQIHAYYNNVSHAHSRLKLRRDFTSRFVVQFPFWTQGLMSLCNYVRLLCLAGAVALDCFNVLPAVVALLLSMASWVFTILPFRRCASLLQAPKLLLSIPLFVMWRPVVNMFYRMRGAKVKASNYTSIYD